MSLSLRAPRRPRYGLRVVVGAAAALTTLVAYIVLASQWAHGRDDAAVPATAPPAPAPSPMPVPVPVPAEPPVVRTPTLGVSAPTPEDLDRFIEVTGTTPEVVDVFEAWSRNRPLDRVVADAVAARGARLSITWEPWDVDVDRTGQPAYALGTIIAGEHDAYIDMFARSIADYGHPVTIRLMHEMNGNWYPWSTGVNGNREGEFVRAWQHVHGRFAALGVTDVQWMWAPNAVYPGSRELAPLYPGDAYVDAVGVSNYNWGDVQRDGWGTAWTSFGSLFDQSFAEVATITGKPLWVAETASSDRGGDRAQWLAAMLAEVSARPGIAGVIWFDHVDEARGVDWRIETDEDAAAAWSAGFAARPVVQEPPA